MENLLKSFEVIFSAMFILILIMFIGAGISMLLKSFKRKYILSVETGCNVRFWALIPNLNINISDGSKSLEIEILCFFIYFDLSKKFGKSPLEAYFKNISGAFPYFGHGHSDRPIIQDDPILDHSVKMSLKDFSDKYFSKTMQSRK